MSVARSRVMASRVVSVLAIGTLLAITACGGGDGPQVPTTFAPNAGSATTLTGVVATQSGAAPQVQILDAKGKGIKGLRVRWKTGAASGVVANDSILTDASGIASSGGWTLGTTAGLQTLTATADGLSPIVFTANVAAGPVANLVRVSQDGQLAAVNTNVPQPPSVRAQDAFGNPVAGVVVMFSVASGGGTITPEQQTTDQNGIATATAWKLGTVVGQQLARATAPGATQAAFSATAVAGPPADILKVAGDNQQAVPGTAVPIAPGVRVVDAFGNAVGNVPVTFTPGPGSGTVTFGTVITDPASGTAFVGSWILGSAPQQTLVATSSSIPGKSVTFNATAVATSFDIYVRWVGTVPSVAIQTAVMRAATKWRSIVLSNSGTSRLQLNAGECGRSWMPAVDTVVSNLVLYARIATIDGPLNQLGNANACLLHQTTGLPAMGTMEFDLDDLSNPALATIMDNVVTHEMGHSLGVGSMWNFRGLLTDAGTADPIFNGPRARTEFLAIGGAAYTGRLVPVENTGGAGTRDLHWRKTVFGNELMTGSIGNGGAPLSRVTVGSLADLGYTVTNAGADNFTFTAFLLGPGASTTTIHLGNDVVFTPLDNAVGRRATPVKPAQPR